jgi:hypothetical protein
MVATLYAIAAVLVIFNHRWLVEKLGWRVNMRVAASFYAAGGLVCAFSQSLSTFTFGRIVMALGCASFFTAGRVLVNQIPPSPKRFVGVKFFASGIAWGGVGGPLLASAALSWGDWRIAFVALCVPAAILLALGEAALPDDRPREGSHFDASGSLILLAGAALVFLALQRSAFDYFSDPVPLALGITIAMPMLVMFVWLAGSRLRPLIRFRELAQQRYLVGLAMFCVCYLVLGANNTVLPLLLLRGLNLPLEIVARELALGALGGVLVWVVLSRLIPRKPAPGKYYALGFALLAAGGLLLSGLSEQAHPEWDVLPALLCSGAFVIATLSTTAVQTFQDLQRDDTVFSHANQAKNLLSQVGVASGMALATLCIQWRSTFHFVRLGESVANGSPVARAWLSGVAQGPFSAFDPVTASNMATAQLGAVLTQESVLLATLDYFRLVGILGLSAAVLAILSVLIALRLRSSVASR